MTLFSPTQLKTLQAAMKRIIPADEAPDAWDGGSGSYLFRQLEGQLQPLLADYRTGLELLNTETRITAQQDFADLSPQGQDDVLSRLETGSVSANWSIDPARFFHMLVNHTIEGYYSDPANGGNLNKIAWQMIGFEVRE